VLRILFASPLFVSPCHRGTGIYPRKGKKKKNMFSIKEQSMKKEIQTNLRFIVLSTVVIILMVSLFTACGDDEEQPKNQNATINLFDNTRTATVKGCLTDTEWSGCASKVETALNGAYTYYESINADVVIGIYNNLFNNNVTIVIEKSPSGYTKWKTSADGKTMYLAFGALDNDLQGSIIAAVEKMSIPEAGFAQARDNVKFPSKFQS
jgi:hypothetical protein